MFDDLWTSPPQRSRCGCGGLRIVRTISGTGTLSDTDTYIAENGSHWKKLGGMADFGGTVTTVTRKLGPDGCLY